MALPDPDGGAVRPRQVLDLAHLRTVFGTGELHREAVVAESATTAADGRTYQVEYFNLDAVLSVGYRVNSKRGTQFRIWATGKLREHLLRGYTLDERRLREKGMGEMEQAVGLARTRLQALWSLIRLSPKLAITSSSPPRAST